MSTRQTNKTLTRSRTRIVFQAVVALGLAVAEELDPIAHAGHLREIDFPILQIRQRLLSVQQVLENNLLARNQRRHEVLDDFAEGGVIVAEIHQSLHLTPDFLLFLRESRILTHENERSASNRIH